MLWFAVWLGWQYTCWVTNWFNPEHPRIRLMLLALMLVGLVLSATIPGAFAEAGLAFGCCLAAIQVGRTLVVLLSLPRGHALLPNFRRIFVWEIAAATLWIAGGLSEGHARDAFWIAGVLCEYVAPMLGFAVPGLGRSSTLEWTIDGGHLAERNQLFVMIALGESILATGASFSQAPHLDLPTTLALVAAFAGSVAMWWVYFDTASRDGTRAIEHAADPGRIGARFHYVHVVLIAGVIVAAVGDELMLQHPAEGVDAAAAWVLLGGPLLYLAGNAAYKRVVYGHLPLSHLVGGGLLVALLPFALHTDRLMTGGLATLILIARGHDADASSAPTRGPLEHQTGRRLTDGDDESLRATRRSRRRHRAGSGAVQPVRLWPPRRPHRPAALFRLPHGPVPPLP